MTETKKAPHPPLKPVDSSAMKAAHYDTGAKTLFVQFNDGSVWAYDGVNLERGTAFEGSASKGRYLAGQIKPFHTARKVG